MPEQLEERFIRGEIIFTIYENSVDQFSIAKIKIHETNEQYEEKEIVGKGNFVNLQKGVVYEFHGRLITHAKYGIQYDIHAYQTFVPETTDAVIAYLSSDLFPGVGKKTAGRIVKTLGEQAIQKILNDPQALKDISGISQKVKQSLYERLEENQGFERVAVAVTKYGIGLKMAQTLYRLYRDETLTIVETNPYRFIFEVDNFGFVTADKIAQMNQIEKDADYRIQASCYYALQLSANEGHVYLPREKCIAEMRTILQYPTITEEKIQEQIDSLIAEKKIFELKDNLYEPSLYHAESRFSERITEMLTYEQNETVTDAHLMDIVGEIEEEQSLSYGTEQFSAIKKALQSPLMILTGGPGTGKTTVVKGIVKTYAKVNDLSVHRHDYDSADDYPFILTAPTGRAAKRLEESTGIRAMTIHRLLGWDGHMLFEKNEHEQLQGKLLVIDEFSMVDTWLAHHLFKAIPEDMQVLIVGDEDQLPSVGPGQVLADLLSSGLIPTVQLSEVYRQKEGSKIIDLAHDIKNDRLEKEQIKKERDFSFIPCGAHQVIEAISTIFERAQARGLDLDHFQVLAPMYRTVAGIDNINKHLQQLINPKQHRKRERIINEVTFRVGDRVLQLVNQPEDGVYNGDIGKIVHILSAKENDDNEDQIIIQFDEKEVTYNRTEYLNFTLAYCISIHKAQGSEFPNVILPVVTPFRRMLRKNLLYTAITRSKQSLIICGELDALFNGIQTIDTNSRYSTLRHYLTTGLQREDSQERMKKATDEKGAHVNDNLNRTNNSRIINKENEIDEVQEEITKTRTPSEQKADKEKDEATHKISEEESAETLPKDGEKEEKVPLSPYDFL